MRDNKRTEPGVLIPSSDIPACSGKNIDIQQQESELKYAKGRQNVIVHTLIPPFKTGDASFVLPHGRKPA